MTCSRARLHDREPVRGAHRAVDLAAQRKALGVASGRHRPRGVSGAIGHVVRVVHGNIARLACDGAPISGIVLPEHHRMPGWDAREVVGVCADVVRRARVVEQVGTVLHGDGVGV